MFKSLNLYRAENARRKKLSEGLKKSPFAKWRLLSIIAVIVVFGSLLYLICFAGKTVIVPRMISKNKLAPIQMVAPFDFEYESEIQTQAKRARNAERIPTLYKIDDDTVESASKNISSAVKIMDETQASYEALKSDGKPDVKFFNELSVKIRNETQLSVSPDDLKTIFELTDLKNRTRIFKQAFFKLKNILRDGVYADDDPIFAHSDAYAFSLSGSRADITGGVSSYSRRAVSESAARRELLNDLKAIGVSDPLVYSIYRTINQQMPPNIVFDEEKTKLKRDEARNAVKPVVVKVLKGDILFDSASMQTPLAVERMKAFRAEEERNGSSVSFNRSFVEYVFSLLMVMTGALFIIISKTQKNKQPRTIGIFCTLLMLNLAFERVVVEVGNSTHWDTNTTFLQLMMYVAPIMLGPIIQVMLFGSYTGFIMAVIIAAITTLMLGEGVVYFGLFLAAALLAIYFCAKATTRPQVIFGSSIYGVFIALISLILGISLGFPLDILWKQSALAVGSGLLTGIVALGLLPIIESCFNRYSNITLLDYTDFNTPLLRRLQIEASGTYHHSVMVAYLAEAAAFAVNANPMVCRVGSLYHDIGKLQRPGFFSENQGGGKNLHDEQIPSMSALIIKNHIREGEELAKIEKLPQQVLDAIEQHHGTSIISYFYNKALKLAESGSIKDPLQALRDAGIDESTYRHEGKKPQTVENAIIMISDSCEAASRSLNRITKHGVEDLVNTIVRSKMTDGQLDECPITVKQLSKIKESIAFTMLNMLHTRIAYNNDKE